MEWLWWGILCALVVVSVLGALGYWDPHVRRTQSGLGLIYTTHGFSRGPVRVLSVGHGWQSGMLLDNPLALVFPYVRAFDAIFCGPGDVRRVLCVGGGGFSYPRSLVARGVAVDAVEIDPRMVAIARQFFELDQALALRNAKGEPLLKVEVGDGFAYLCTSRATYDAIVIDAYNGMVAEASLMSSQAFAAAKAHLGPQGALAVNVATPYSDPSWLVDCVHTMGDYFSRVYVISCTPGADYQERNHVVVGSNVPFELPHATQLLGSEEELEARE